eukprot:s952_g13.t1
MPRNSIRLQEKQLNLENEELEKRLRKQMEEVRSQEEALQRLQQQALDLANKAAAPETPEAPAPAPATDATEPKRSSMLSFRSPLHRARSGLTAFYLDKSTEAI